MTTVRLDTHLTVSDKHPVARVLASRYTLPNPAYQKALDLGFKPVKKRKVDGETVEEPIPPKLRLFQHKGGLYTFPRGSIEAVQQGGHTDYIVDDQTEPGKLPRPVRSLVTLRPYQVDFVGILAAALENGYGAIGRAEPGFGKTISALELIARLGRKTLVVVHKEFLMTQWIERILGTDIAARKLGIALDAFDGVQPPALDLGPEDVGIVQQDVAEWEGRSIVIAMAQSLNARRYDEAFYASFGLVIVDEVHRFAAPTFERAITQFPAAKRLGLTATVERKDGLEDIFLAHIGPVVAEGTVPRKAPRVNLVPTPVIVTSGLLDTLKAWGSGRPDFNKELEFLTTHEGRNRLILRVLGTSVEKGRKTIVLSDRLEHLNVLKAGFADTHPLVETAFYVGGMKLVARKEAERATVLFATYAMAAEALDIPALDTVFLVTPKANVEQAVGRITRLFDGKRDPAIVDFVDARLPISGKLATKREIFYRAEGWLKDVR